MKCLDEMKVQHDPITKNLSASDRHRRLVDYDARKESHRLGGKVRIPANLPPGYKRWSIEECVHFELVETGMP